jgi:broad specificity phosphatase PhoE
MEIAIVSHGVLIKTLLCDTENRALSQLWQAPAMHNCARSIIDVYEDGSRQISLYSDQPYQS